MTSLADDKGKDLAKAEVQQRFGRHEAAFEPGGTISEDGKYCTMEVTAPGVPTKGATTLTLSGQAVLRVATQKKDFAAENVALKPGTTVKAGPISFSITRAGKSEWGGSGSAFSVTFETKQNLDAVADIQFFDAAGKKIEAERTAWGTMGFAGNVTAQWTYDLKRKVDSAKIVIWYWTDMKKVTVPLDLTVGVGL